MISAAKGAITSVLRPALSAESRQHTPESSRLYPKSPEARERVFSRAKANANAENARAMISGAAASDANASAAPRGAVRSRSDTRRGALPASPRERVSITSISANAANPAKPANPCPNTARSAWEPPEPPISVNVQTDEGVNSSAYA